MPADFFNLPALTKKKKDEAQHGFQRGYVRRVFDNGVPKLFVTALEPHQLGEAVIFAQAPDPACFRLRPRLTTILNAMDSADRIWKRDGFGGRSKRPLRNN